MSRLPVVKLCTWTLYLFRNSNITIDWKSHTFFFGWYIFRSDLRVHEKRSDQTHIAPLTSQQANRTVNDIIWYMWVEFSKNVFLEEIFINNRNTDPTDRPFEQLIPNWKHEHLVIYTFSFTFHSLLSCWHVSRCVSFGGSRWKLAIFFVSYFLVCQSVNFYKTIFEGVRFTWFLKLRDYRKVDF